MVLTTKLGRKMREDAKYSFFELSILIFIFSVHQLGAKHTALKFYYVSSSVFPVLLRSCFPDCDFLKLFLLSSSYKGFFFLGGWG